MSGSIKKFEKQFSQLLGHYVAVAVVPDDAMATVPQPIVPVADGSVMLVRQSLADWLLTQPREIWEKSISTDKNGQLVIASDDYLRGLAVSSRTHAAVNGALVGALAAQPVSLLGTAATQGVFGAFCFENFSTIFAAIQAGDTASLAGLAAGGAQQGLAASTAALGGVAVTTALAALPVLGAANCVMRRESINAQSDAVAEMVTNSPNHPGERIWRSDVAMSDEARSILQQYLDESCRDAHRFVTNTLREWFGSPKFSEAV